MLNTITSVGRTHRAPTWIEDKTSVKETVYRISQAVETLIDSFSPRRYPLANSPLALELEHSGVLVARSVVGETPPLISSIPRIYQFLSNTIMSDAELMQARLGTLEALYFFAIEKCKVALIQPAQTEEALSDSKLRLSHARARSNVCPPIS
ncbi:uncharacterized protein SCHCODRAFT_01104668 [Schizophyllum commune H4-8]|nr:uncharacterized protein SCHCODRAFT_01104668 [Schizophyllum commune H4-8]KAI5888091.1 hypothetical protein SCHCODRAFT_01104668 [Schizophyllum commune H4-8]